MVAETVRFRHAETEFLGRFEPTEAETPVLTPLFEPSGGCLTPAFPAEFPLFILSGFYLIASDVGLASHENTLC